MLGKIQQIIILLQISQKMKEINMVLNFMLKLHHLIFKIQQTHKMDKQVTENHLMKQVEESLMRIKILILCYLITV